MTQTPSNLFEDDGNEIPAEGTLEVTGEEQTQDLLQSIDELDKSSIIETLYPFSISATVVCDPIYPSPPVTRIDLLFIRIWYAFYNG